MNQLNGNSHRNQDIHNTETGTCDRYCSIFRIFTQCISEIFSCTDNSNVKCFNEEYLNQCFDYENAEDPIGHSGMGNSEILRMNLRQPRVTCSVTSTRTDDSSESFYNDIIQYSNSIAELLTSDDTSEEYRRSRTSIDLPDVDPKEDIVFSGSCIIATMKSLTQVIELLEHLPFIVIVLRAEARWHYSEHDLSVLLAYESNWGWTENVYDQLPILLSQSKSRKVRMFLIENNFINVATVTLRTCNEPCLISMIVGIITNMCCNDEEIDLIGNDEHLATTILSHFKFDKEIIALMQLLKILLSIVYRIQRNPQSVWINHFAKCGPFEDSIILMLNTLTYDDIEISKKLLQFISTICLLHQLGIVGQLFASDKLISPMLTFFLRVIPKREEASGYPRNELIFIEIWLVIMTLRQLDFTKFEDDRKEYFFKLMEIIYRILKPYYHSCILYPKLSKTSVSVIIKSMILLSRFRRGMDAPLKINNILVNIISHFKMNLADSERTKAVTKSMIEFSKYLEQYWLHMLTLSSDAQINDILYSCQSEARKYLMNLAKSNPNVTPDMLKKIHKIERLYNPPQVFYL